MQRINLFELPYNKIKEAIDGGYNKDICFIVGGGIGDKVCAEPTLRFALDTLTDSRISLACAHPEIFSHLKFRNVFTNKERADGSSSAQPTFGYLFLLTYPNSQLLNQFISPNLTHCVDYPAIASLRLQVPNAYKELKLVAPKFDDLAYLSDPKYVLLHLGKSWPSRTLPGSWWNKVIEYTTMHGHTPVLIGNNCTEVSNTDNVIDMRDKLSFEQFLSVVQGCKRIITNDSSPLHIAATGEARIAYVATCKSGELLMHWRNGQYGWNMKDFGKNDMWKMYDYTPTHLETIRITDVPPGYNIKDFMPQPKDITEWVCS